MKGVSTSRSRGGQDRATFETFEVARLSRLPNVASVASIIILLPALCGTFFSAGSCTEDVHEDFVYAPIFLLYYFPPGEITCLTESNGSRRNPLFEDSLTHHCLAAESDAHSLDQSSCLHLLLHLILMKAVLKLIQ